MMSWGNILWWSNKENTGVLQSTDGVQYTFSSKKVEPWSIKLIQDGCSVAFVVGTGGMVYNIFVLPDSGTASPVASKQYLFTA